MNMNIKYQNPIPCLSSCWLNIVCMIKMLLWLIIIIGGFFYDTRWYLSDKIWSVFVSTSSIYFHQFQNLTCGVSLHWPRKPLLLFYLCNISASSNRIIKIIAPFTLVIDQQQQKLIQYFYHNLTPICFKNTDCPIKNCDKIWLPFRDRKQ